jgi:branched-subunit amino acid transport protein
MSTATVTLLVLAAITYTLKSAGPLALAGRTFPAWIDRIVAVLPIPLLAALVVTSTLANGEEWAFDARIAGLAAAGVALWRRLPFVVVVIIAGAATAAVRAIAG